MEVLHSNIIGSGFPLIILHGYFGMGDNWKSQANNLSGDFEVHLVDQRNHGRSFHSEEFSYELMVQDLKHYFEVKNIDKAIVLGHSMGGKTAMLFAVEYPELVEKLVVADIAPKYYAPHHHTIIDALNSVDFSILKLRTEVDDILKQSIAEEGVRQFLLKNVYRKTKTEMAFRFNLKSLTENNSEVGEALPAYTTYNGEVLFLRGQKSDYILDDDFALISAHFENAKIETVSNAGHWLHAENPSEFYNKLIAFIK
ncbi:alpha/beta fold hydrolase [Wenyingzhuangia marina]|uniref:Pimeloyl-ACP methyl ester carboxylesterase n=1 Tax=Wenyingzhuangia marina TaxID=1195760 RepID=A0A1M5T0Y6_9FLAO|nr:alpha/beta fold hydrolase [Wenyingzhuangia marina]GGF64984.1 alpha/beta hydrolase [Wenyingzhuangia marina]SHH44484.1 Pimeloyl-ACP methyl ester carboxylesterase [Wenyingzhuangia marina]